MHQHFTFNRFKHPACCARLAKFGEVSWRDKRSTDLCLSESMPHPVHWLTLLVLVNWETKKLTPTQEVLPLNGFFVAKAMWRLGDPSWQQEGSQSLAQVHPWQQGNGVTCPLAQALWQQVPETLHGHWNTWETQESVFTATAYWKPAPGALNLVSHLLQPTMGVETVLTDLNAVGKFMRDLCYWNIGQHNCQALKELLVWTEHPKSVVHSILRAWLLEIT